MSAVTSSGSDPADTTGVTPFRIPAGVPVVAADVPTNVLSTIVRNANTRSSITALSALGDESRTASSVSGQRPPTFNGVSVNRSLDHLLAVIVAPSATQYPWVPSVTRAIGMCAGT